MEWISTAMTGGPTGTVRIASPPRLLSLPRGRDLLPATCPEGVCLHDPADGTEVKDVDVLRAMITVGSVAR